MRLRARCSALAPALLALLVSSRALAADWYVDAAAAAGGDGSQAKPFSTVNAALAGLSRGDTVWLATGTYDEVLDVAKLPGTSGTTTFRAMPGATPVIDGTSGSSATQFVVQTSVPNTTFQDLTIQNAMNGALGIQFYYADGGQVIHCTTKNISGGNAVNLYYANQGTVRDSTLQGDVGGRKTTGTVVENNEIYGSSAEGVGIYDGSTNAVVRHNVIHDNTSVNLYLDSISHSLFDGNLIYESSPNSGVIGIELSDEGHYADLAAPVNSYNTIINNVVVGHAVGIDFWYSDEWSTQALNDQSGLRYDVIANNTLIDNAGGIRWDASPAHVGTTIQNNVVLSTAGSSPSYLLYAKSVGGITLDHNLWFGPLPAVPLVREPDGSPGLGHRLGHGRGRRARRPEARGGRDGAPGGQRGARRGLSRHRRGRDGRRRHRRLPRRCPSRLGDGPGRVPVRRHAPRRRRRGAHGRRGERQRRWLGVVDDLRRRRGDERRERRRRGEHRERGLGREREPGQEQRVQLRGGGSRGASGVGRRAPRGGGVVGAAAAPARAEGMSVIHEDGACGAARARPERQSPTTMTEADGLFCVHAV
jgi:hypothetical protein